MDDVNKAVKGLKDELTKLGKFMKDLNLGEVGGLGKSVKDAASGFERISRQEAGIRNAAIAVRQLVAATHSLVRAQSGLQNYNTLLGNINQKPGYGNPSSPANRPPTQQNLFSGIPGPSGGRPSSPAPASQPPFWSKNSPNAPLFLRQGNQLVPNPAAMVASPSPVQSYTMPRLAPVAMPPQSHHLTPRLFDNKFGSFMGDVGSSAMWLLRHGIAGLGIYGGLTAGREVASWFTGEPQQEQLKARKSQHAAGATRADRSLLELEAMRLNSKYPFTKTSNISELQGEFGTYFPISEIGPSPIARMTEYGAVLQEIGQIKDPRMVADVLAGPTRVKLNRMSEQERKSKLARGSDWVEKDIKRNYAILSKADEIFPMQGKDMAEFFKHALVMTERSGMPLEEAIVDLGMSRQAAMRASTSGRGERTMLPKMPEWIAKMMMLGDPESKKMSEKDQKTTRKGLEEWIRRQTDQDPSSMYMLWAKAYTMAQQYHRKPAETIGVDKEWLPSMEMKSTEELLKLRENYLKQTQAAAENPNPLADVQGKGKTGDLYTPWEEVSKSAYNAALALSNLATSGGMVQTVFQNLKGVYDKVADTSQQKAMAIQYANQAKSKAPLDEDGMPIYGAQYDIDRWENFKKIQPGDTEAQYRYIKETDMPKDKVEAITKPIRGLWNWFVETLQDVDVATSAVHGDAINMAGMRPKKGGGFTTASELLGEMDQERKEQFVQDWLSKQANMDNGSKELKGSAGELSVAAQLLSSAAQALNIVSSNSQSPLMRGGQTPSLFGGAGQGR